MDTFCYERQSAGSMEVGSYAHRPIFHHPDDIPSNEEAALSPTELPFTADDFDQQLEEAIELMGDILETAEIRYAINGLLSLTPDAMPVLGETVEVRNLWSAAAVWIKEGPGIAQLVAEWMTLRLPAPVRSAHQRHQPLLPARAHGAPHPGPLRRALQQDLRHRPPARAVGDPSAACGAARSTHAKRRSGRCSSTPAAGSGRSGTSRNAALVREVPRRRATAPHEWDARWWSPITNAEHLAMRDSVGMVDLTAFNEFDIDGPGRARPRCSTSPSTRSTCRSGARSTRRCSRPTAGSARDLTILRLGEEHFRVDHRRVRRRARPVLVPQVPARRRLGDVHRHVGRRCARIGLWGPKARLLTSWRR